MISNTKTYLSPETIQTLVSHHFGDIRVTDIRELTEGFFNAIYVVSLSKPVRGHEKLVLKVGVKEGKHINHYEKDALRVELDVYGRLRQVGIPVAEILASDTTGTLVSCHYFFMAFLEGDTWGHLSKTLTEDNVRHLQHALGVYTATMHTITGPYFGYLKEDPSYHFATWREAFHSFVLHIIEDCVHEDVPFDFSEVWDALALHWDLLDAITEPSLVNFDMWSKNIMLRYNGQEYVVDAFIDHERSFFGDPVAEFISTQTICGPIEQAEAFQTGYSSVRPFSFTREDRIRLGMYEVYVALIVCADIYRCSEDREARHAGNLRFLRYALDKLKAAAS